MTQSTKTEPPISKEESWKIFDQIAPRYDLLNRVLSLGLDVRWRRRLGGFLPETPHIRLLDLATGTADVPLILMQHVTRVDSASGIDMSQKMLDIGQRKVRAKGLESKIELRHGDAAAIPYPEENFDALTIAFGIRNLPDIHNALQEMKRVLRPGGRALILEFSLPTNRLIRPLYLVYLRHLVPLIGYIISGHYRAYRYLNRTIETFPYGKDFCALMEEAGFGNVRANTLMFGIASIYQGDKP